MSELAGQIAEIPEALARCAEQSAGPIGEAAQAWRSAPPSAVFTIARGTSDAAASHAARLFVLRLGVPACSLQPSLVTMHGFRGGSNGAVALAISQSGESPDLVGALCAFGRECRWALTNVDGSPLEAEASVRIPIGAGVEKSVAATKSFACSLLALSTLVAALEGDAGGVDSGACSESAAAGLARPADLSPLAGCKSAFVLGRGSTLPVAQEVALKLKETAGLHAEAVSAAEVMHGPKALAGPQMPALALAPPGEAGRSVAAAAEELKGLGSPTVLLESGEGEDELSALLRQLSSFYAALPGLVTERGLDPDSQPALSKVTRTY